MNWLKALRRTLSPAVSRNEAVRIAMQRITHRLAPRDIAANPPAGWSLQRQREYFDWAKAVIDGLRGTHLELECLFDTAHAARP